MSDAPTRKATVTLYESNKCVEPIQASEKLVQEVTYRAFAHANRIVAKTSGARQ